MQKTFSETGYLILNNAISGKLISEVQSNIYGITGVDTDLKYNQYVKFCNIVKNNKTSEFDFVKPIFEYICYKGLIEKILLEKKLYNSIAELLGKDLSFCNDPSIILNLPNKSSPKKNYLFKDWHQEIWSGASPSTIQIWIPLINKAKVKSTLQIMEDSHKWGHIPHSNRAPTLLPKNPKITTVNLQIGDVLIFSSLLLHRSMKVNSPTLYLPILLKNFKVKDHSFQNNRSWKIFSYSEITKIEKILGNHYLSPFRLKDIK